MTKAKYLYLLAIVIVITTIASPGAGWGWTTHSWLADKGMDTIIDFLPGLNLSEHRSTVETYATRPDSWKGDYGYEGIRHYLDHDIDNGEVDRAVLSWTILLAEELQWSNPDYEFVAKVCGVLSHYVMDLSQPLHCTSNYNPDTEYYENAHGAIDGWLQNNDAFDDIQLPVMTPDFIEDVYNYTLKQIETNFDLAENELIPAMIDGDSRVIDEIVKAQAVKAIQFFVDLVYTAKMRSNETNIELAMNPNDIPLLDLQLEPSVHDNTTGSLTTSSVSSSSSTQQTDFTARGWEMTMTISACLVIILAARRPRTKT